MMMSSQRTRISTLLSLLWLLQLVTRHNAMTIKDDVVPSQVRSLANNNYNNYNNNYYRQANQQQYQNTDDDYMPALTICDDLIIQVTSIQTVCDSPATYYWGSGVNRNSLTCNFGDKATTTISFDVTESLYDTNIYVVMSMYAGYGNEVLTSTTPKNIKKYVGYSCNEAGSYSYTYSTTVGSAYSSSGKNYGSFIPFIQVAFSSDKNGDYNLGAANIPCQWDNRGVYAQALPVLVCLFVLFVWYYVFCLNDGLLKGTDDLTTRVLSFFLCQNSVNGRKLRPNGISGRHRIFLWSMVF